MAILYSHSYPPLLHIILLQVLEGISFQGIDNHYMTLHYKCGVCQVYQSVMSHLQAMTQTSTNPSYLDERPRFLLVVFL